MALSDEEDGPPNVPPLQSLSGVRVLILDDSNDAALALSHAIEHLGGESFVAHTVTEAKRLLVVMEPDAAIIDCVLANGHGLAIIREFQEFRPSLGCVLTSGFDVPAGFEDLPFLPKPIQLAKIVETVLDAIGRVDTVPPKTERE